jgi:formylglycine-generating enzyme required for sulfatase activity
MIKVNIESKMLMLPGGISLEVLRCPPGRFLMGSDEGEAGRDSDERLHSVLIEKEFWLGRFPVTQQQWVSVMKSNQSHILGNDLPIVNVSFEDCLAFTRAAGGVGIEMRLPTEPEWEYACRAGTSTAYSWGNGADGEFDVGHLRLVSQCRMNPWGFFGMHGNVFEWCSDWYDVDYGLGTGEAMRFDAKRYRVVRGGSWASSKEECRSAFRSRELPDFKSHEIGFRVCVAIS